MINFAIEEYQGKSGIMNFIYGVKVGVWWQVSALRYGPVKLEVKTDIDKAEEYWTAKARRTRRKKRKGWSIFHLPGKRQMKRHPWQKPLPGFCQNLPRLSLAYFAAWASLRAACPAPILVRYGEEVANLVEELAIKIGARGRLIALYLSLKVCVVMWLIILHMGVG